MTKRPIPNFLVLALYKFIELPDFAELKDPLLACCLEHEIRGTLLLAQEGINGTIAGKPEQAQAILAYLRADPRFADLAAKESYAEKQPFNRMKVRLKREIVTMGVPDLNPAQMAGTYVEAQDWNQLIQDPDVIVVDARNDYEVAVGTFQGAVNPQTKSFSELPAWLEQETSLQAKPKVAMFCTGGIRCEKSTAFLRSKGFEKVYHLQGGILKYLETIPEEQSLWQGECFVFDERVTVVHGLKPGNYELCRACRQPISQADKTSPFFKLGISCPHCYGQKSPERQKQFAERQRQIELAQARQQNHLWVSFPTSAAVEPDTNETLPILYSFRRCPFAIRARLALAVSGIQCELREVVLRDKPQELLEASPKGTVPVLIAHQGKVIEHSLEIMLWALNQKDPEEWLQPEQGSLAEMQELIQVCDTEFKHHLDRYKYATRYTDVDTLTERSKAATFLKELDHRLQAQDYLYGSRLSLADMAILPFVRQFYLADPDWFNAQPWAKLQAWLARWVDSAAYTNIMQKYPQWAPGQPQVMFPNPTDSTAAQG